MAYITREDGERFIIPSYRDVLSAKKPALLKREILLLSSTYGEYVAIHRKNINQYEVAFSPDQGYLLGESVWNNFKKSSDLIYCEAIPNTEEVILVIVKSGSVYVDGSFAKDSVAEELIVFRTQQNNFDIYVYGDVPISKEPEDNKFTLDASSVKSFNVLENPIFQTLPLNKSCYLQRVQNALKAQNIGVLPIKTILAFISILLLLYVAFKSLVVNNKQVPQVFITMSSPFQPYIHALATPNPADEMQWLSYQISLFFSIPGWVPAKMHYADGVVNASVYSIGSRTNVLFNWANTNKALIGAFPDGFMLSKRQVFPSRIPPRNIYPLVALIGNLTDMLSYVIPGNNLTLGKTIDKGKFKEMKISIAFNLITAPTLAFIGQQLNQLPVVLNNVDITVDNGSLSGTITLSALGS